MTFNAIVGNPPYNADLYIPFVTKSMENSSSLVAMITPAKWQTKGGKQNDEFRSVAVPRMSEVVYFPNAREVFDIDCQGGICYYLIDRDIHRYKKLKTVCGYQKLLETDGTESVELDSNNSYILYNSKIRDIVNKVRHIAKLDGNTVTDKTYGSFNQLRPERNAEEGKFNVAITDVYFEKDCTKRTGLAMVLCRPYITTSTLKRNEDTTFLESFQTFQEASSYLSYIDSKFVRFMFLMAKNTLHMRGVNAWKFVPKPSNFDHIFTDSELYSRYSLTDDEINLIERVIRDREAVNTDKVTAQA